MKKTHAIANEKFEAQPLIRITQAGNQASLQDLGRIHAAHLGVSQSGALDPWAIQIINAVLSNSPNDAVIEFAGNRFTWTTLSACVICLGSFSAEIKVNQHPIRHSRWTPISLSEGDEVSILAKEWSVRHYVAVSGGFSGNKQFSSVATDNLAGLGGNLDTHQGSAGSYLRNRDTLYRTTNDKTNYSSGHDTRAPLAVPLSLDGRLRCIAGPEYPLLDKPSRQRLASSGWQISPNSNRMGYRLESDYPLSWQSSSPAGNLNSHAVLPGIIQLPPSGQPLVLLADAGTTGGYPRIAKIIDSDLWKLAHIPLGHTLSLELVDDETAIDSLKRQQIHLNKIRIACHGNRK